MKYGGWERPKLAYGNGKLHLVGSETRVTIEEYVGNSKFQWNVVNLLRVENQRALRVAERIKLKVCVATD